MYHILCRCYPAVQTLSLLQKHVTCRTNVYHTLCRCYPAVQTLSLLQKHVTRRTFCVPHSVQVLPSSQKSPRHPSPTSPTANVYIGICPPSLSPGEWPGIFFFAGDFQVFRFFFGYHTSLHHPNKTPPFSCLNPTLSSLTLDPQP